MTKYNYTVALIVLMCSLSLAQTPELVVDYVEGAEGSVTGTVFHFQNTLVYQGTSDIGYPAILQYDKSTDAVTVLTSSDDFDGEIAGLATNTLEILFLIRRGSEGSPVRQLYRAFESDLSDITLLYDAGDAELITFRAHRDHYMIIEEYEVDNEAKVNLKVVATNGTVTDFLTALPGLATNYRFTAVDGHFLVQPREDLIDGKSILVYDILSGSEIPIIDLIPDFQDCGLLTRLGALNDNIIYYNCGSSTFIYDLARAEYLPSDDRSYSFIYDRTDLLFVSYQGQIGKIIKSTGQFEAIEDQVLTFSISSPYLTTYTPNGLDSDIKIMNLETDQIFSFPLAIEINSFLFISRLAAVPQGIHMMLFDFDSGDGVMLKVDEDGMQVISEIPGLSFSDRPIVYGEDIYFTYNDPDVGRELFVIDYEVSSANEVSNQKKVSVFPNPASTTIRIESGEKAIPDNFQIIDSQGAIRIDQIYQPEVDISALQAGLYFIHLNYADGRIAIAKFLKV